MSAQMAFGRGMSRGAHSVGGDFAGRRLAVSPFRRNFAFRRKNLAPGGWWPYYYNDYDAYGDMDTASVPKTSGSEPIPAPVCQRSEEIVRVPAEGGGTRQIKIIRCP
jgi:hypothetical protein